MKGAVLYEVGHNQPTRKESRFHERCSAVRSQYAVENRGI